MRVIGLVALTTVVLTGCAPASATPATDTMRCGAPTALETFSQANPEYHGHHLLHIGPLWLSNVDESHSEAVIADFQPGIPTKAPIYFPSPITTTVTLRGSACADGGALHFWYKPDSPTPVGQTVGHTTLRQVGETSVDFMPSPTADYTGYILFWAPGKYRLATYQGANQLAAAVVTVPQ